MTERGEGLGSSVDVAVVSRDERVRLAAARAFDKAPPSWRVRLHEETPDQTDVLVLGTDMETESDGGLIFDPDSSDSIVQRITNRLGRERSRSYLVAGAGGGVGTTSIALHLAQAAAKRHATCYLEAGCPWSTAVRLGIDVPHLTWGDPDSEEGSSDGLPPNIALPVAGGFRAMLAPENFDGTAFDVAVRNAREGFERTFIDCSEPRLAGSLCGMVDAVILVVPFTAQGAHRAARFLSRHPKTRFATVLNRLGPGGELTSAALHRILGHRSALQLPCSPALRDAEDESKLLTSEWSRYVRKINRLLVALEATGVRE